MAILSSFATGQAAAQYLSDTSAPSTSGGSMGTITAPSAAQGKPLGFGAGISNNKVSLAGWQAYRNYRNGSSGSSGNTESSPHIARLGQVRMSLSASAGVAYDTNINNSPTNPLTDIYTNLSVNLSLYWKATKKNDFRLTLGLNYTEYLEYQQYNTSGLFLDPYTGLDYRIYFQDFALTLYDYPSITNGGGQSDPAITNSVNFQQLNNRGGLSLLWHPNQLLFMTGFERSDVLSLTNDEFSSQNSTIYSWFGMVSYDITPTTGAGLRMQASSTTYAQQVLNNSVTAQAGLFCQSRLTEYTSIYFEAGMQTASFYDTGRQTSTLQYQETNGFNTNVQGTLGGSDYTQPYFQLTLSNRPTRYLTHSLTLSRQASGSAVSNYEETNTATYGLQYRLNRVITASALLNYEFGKISHTSSPLPYSNFNGGLNFSFRIMKNTDFGIGYNYYKNELAELNANYTRQVFTITMSHQF